MGKLGFFLPRTLSRAFTSQGNNEAQPFRTEGRVRTSPGEVLRERQRRRGEPSGQSTPDPSASTLTRPVYRIGGTVIRDEEAEAGTVMPVERSGPSIPQAAATDRAIRFPDERG